MRTQPASGQPASEASASGSAAAQGPTGTAATSGATGTNGSSPDTSAAANGRPAHAIRVSLAGPGGWAGRRRSAVALIRRIPGMLRVHWLASILIALGIVLRALAQIAYHPAIIYIDTLKYLYDAWPGSDPVGYKVPLKLILAVGDLGTVELVQHLL